MKWDCVTTTTKKKNTKSVVACEQAQVGVHRVQARPAVLLMFIGNITSGKAKSAVKY